MFISEPGRVISEPGRVISKPGRVISKYLSTYNPLI